MTKYHMFSSFVFVLSVLFSGNAFAQAGGCTAPYQLIFEMREGGIGSYNVWDSIYGEQGRSEHFVEALPVGEEGSNLVVGERFARTGAELDILFVQIDRRGRMEWEKTHRAQGVRKVVAFERHDKGYIVVADKDVAKGHGVIWVGLFDFDGQFIKAKEIKHKKGNLFAHDLLTAKEGGGYVLAASFEDQSGSIESHTIIYHIDAKGRVVSDRAFQSGLENKILGLNHSQARGYYATGYIYDDTGRKTGWALGLNEDASILWQRQYPRGYGAQIRTARAYGPSHLIVTGDADPYGGENIAGWVMLLNGSDGEVVWQRYYRGVADFYGRDLLISPEGLVSVMMDVQPSKNGEKAGHVRLLTLNSRGDLLFGDTYFNGLDASAYKMFLGPGGQRLMVGTTQVAYQIEGIDGAEGTVRKSFEGWLISAVEVEPYDDPCVQGRR